MFTGPGMENVTGLVIFQSLMTLMVIGFIVWGVVSLFRNVWGKHQDKIETTVRRTKRSIKSKMGK